MLSNSQLVQIRPTEVADLECLFQFQTDKEAGFLAAFMPIDPFDKTLFMKKHKQLLNNPTINYQTITIEDVIIGSIAKFVMDDQAEITYWIDRNYWGQGIVTSALNAFLSIESARPIYAHVAFDNIGSQRVLEKCGFVKVGTDLAFANARQTQIEEIIYKLS
jgi:[ribosomal protein S5]-alanine N-acetyltransferase